MEREKVQRFGSGLAIRENTTAGEVPLCKAYQRSGAARTEVDDDVIRITGDKTRLVQAIGGRGFAASGGRGFARTGTP